MKDDGGMDCRTPWSEEEMQSTVSLKRVCTTYLLLKTVLHPDHVTEEAILLPQVANLDLELGGLALQRLDSALRRFELQLLLRPKAGGLESAYWFGTSGEGGRTRGASKEGENGRG